MKTLIVALLASLLGAITVNAASIHVEWGYTPPTEPTLTGFRLYHNGAQAHEWMDPAATSGDADVTGPALGDYFTLTAMFDDNSESPHSVQYIWTDGYQVIIFHHWLWFFKPSHKNTRVGETGLTGARIR